MKVIQIPTMTYKTTPEIAALFFRNDAKWIEDTIDTVSTLAIHSVYTAYFITAKQFNWLKNTALMEHKQTVMISSQYGKTAIDGSFEKDGITYFFTATEIKGGAAKFKLMYFPKRTVAANFDMQNILNVFAYAAIPELMEEVLG